MNRKLPHILLAFTLAMLMTGPVMADSDQVDAGQAEKGEQIYAKRCLGCHGAEGDGLGPAAERLNPPPRDFTAGTYKIKTSGYDDMVPNDEDVIRMIREGMPGTAMPGWSDVLSDQDILALVAYIKTFAGYEEEVPSEQLDYGEQVPSSPDSLARGKELFSDGDRCSECHGKQGKGDAIKRLKDDNGDRTWPRNLTKPWTFRDSNDPRDIYTRISVGIPGTQMPAFADPTSKKKLDIEDRWHLANYVISLAKTEKVVRADNTVVKADKVSGDLPDTPDNPAWQQAVPSTFYLIPQIIAEERFFTPSNDTITVKALYNDQDIALLLEWDDRTRSIPGDEEAEKIADPGLSEDKVAVQLPVSIPEGTEKPYFGMGDVGNMVNIWYWQSGTTDNPETTELMNSRGYTDTQKREAKDVGLQASGKYEEGTWQVLMRRPLRSEQTEKGKEQDLQFSEGKPIPIAFAVWDGSNSEKGSKHTMTGWYWLLLKPAATSGPLIASLLVILLIALGQFWWVRSASQGVTRNPDETNNE